MITLNLIALIEKSKQERTNTVKQHPTLGPLLGDRQHIPQPKHQSNTSSSRSNDHKHHSQGSSSSSADQKKSDKNSRLVHELLLHYQKTREPLSQEWRDVVTNFLHPEEMRMDVDAQAMFEEILESDAKTVSPISA